MLGLKYSLKEFKHNYYYIVMAVEKSLSWKLNLI